MKVNPAARYMAGLTLIEVMVAITISLILMGGAITLLVNSKVAYRANEDLSRLQEDARFAVTFLTEDLRMSGFFGCNGEPDVRRFQATPPGPGGKDGGALFELDFAVEGLDDAMDPPAFLPSGLDAGDGAYTNVFANRLPNTDALTLRFLDGRTVQTVTAPATTSGAVTIPDTSDFAQGEVAAIYDCRNSDFFRISNDPAGGNVLDHGGIGRQYESDGDVNNMANPRVAKMKAVRYYVGNTDDVPPIPALFREVFDPTSADLSPEANPEPLIEGVESMQLLYGVDQNADEVIDCFLPANADPTPCPVSNASLQTETDWANVSAVRVALLMRTLQPQGLEQSTINNYQLNDVDFDVPPAGPDIGDNFHRRVFNTTVLVRNGNLQDLTRAPPGGGGGEVGEEEE